MIVLEIYMVMFTDFPPEPEYNPEAPGIAVPPPPIYWPGPGIPPPHFLRGPPPPLMEKAPVTRELVTVIEPKAELKGKGMYIENTR